MPDERFRDDSQPITPLLHSDRPLDILSVGKKTVIKWADLLENAPGDQHGATGNAIDGLQSEILIAILFHDPDVVGAPGQATETRTPCPQRLSSGEADPRDGNSNPLIPLARIHQRGEKVAFNGCIVVQKKKVAAVGGEKSHAQVMSARKTKILSGFDKSNGGKTILDGAHVILRAVVDDKNFRIGGNGIVERFDTPIGFARSVEIQENNADFRHGGYYKPSP
ncbi:MAG: hypothetical protein A2Z34_00790 [Planctomycetes bacterium RBG_16_59_8]|nr:MAG: hypothetical protein A2Z34_00790 [Planctomycetes bacterium RBG_16_59_8]